MLRNKELQSIILKLIFFQILIAIVAVLIVSYYMNYLNTSIVDYNQALVGNILASYPELEKDVIPYITKEVSEEKISIGIETLKKYGYTDDIKTSSQAVFKNTYPSFLMIIFLSIILLIIPLIFLVMGEYNKIYCKVRKVYRSAEQVVEGDFNVQLQDEGEGEFNILNHQFNQMANRLKNTLETLENEKVFLKNTISDISHQLKTPLSSLIMLNDIMLEDKNMEQEVKQNFIERSQEQLERMEWLIINLLKVARIEAGAIDFKKEKVSLKEVVQTSISALKSKFPVMNISIETSKNIKGLFYGDKEWTIEAIINILKNALEHSGEDKRIDIYIQETPLFSTITVKDYGKGIQQKDLPYIFKRFYRGSSDAKSDSIGIGLNLAKLIVESQEGTISVMSKKEGTTFTISFLHT
jgi:hypothetical protein